MDAFQIIVPVFVAQLTIAFTWFTNVSGTAVSKCLDAGSPCTFG